MNRELERAIAGQLGASVRRSRALGGGSISQAWAVELDDGRAVFIKAHAGAAPGMFAAEARGLAWLRAGLGPDASLTVPEVLCVEDGFLVLELIEASPRAASFDEQLGRGLAELHRGGADEGQREGFGLDHDNFIGSEPQQNAPLPDWPSFYRARRLEPMLARARDAGTVDRRFVARFDPLFAQLDQLCGPPEPPARLHGDLWSGNLIVGRAGEPVLIDPAVYRGHREIDLAMMRLFGGFGSRCFAAYAEAWPLAPGSQQRVDLYQLYPLLVHVVLFGGGYVASVEAALRRLV